MLLFRAAAPATTSFFCFEDREIHGLSLGFIAGVVRVQVIAGIELGLNRFGLFGSRVAASKSTTASNAPDFRIQSLLFTVHVWLNLDVVECRSFHSVRNTFDSDRVAGRQRNIAYHIA